MQPDTCIRKGSGKQFSGEWGRSLCPARSQVLCSPVGRRDTAMAEKDHWSRGEQERGWELRGWEVEERRREKWCQEFPAVREVDLSTERWQSESHILKCGRIIS